MHLLELLKHWGNEPMSGEVGSHKLIIFYWLARVITKLFPLPFVLFDSTLFSQAYYGWMCNLD